jgi:hypothetical protein
MAREQPKTTWRQWLLVPLLIPVLVVAGGIALLCLPFYLLYRASLRVLVQVLWVARGKRILLIYSHSPVWQSYVEANWLPRLAGQAIVLNWSDRSTWTRTRPFAAVVFRHWAPATNYNPMALLFGPFLRTRRIGFYEAFRDWKHGNEAKLRAAEAELLEFVARG